MIFHFIAITSDYVQGRRIGWHYASGDKLDKDYITSFMKEVESKCGDIQLGVHKLSTDSSSWESVVAKDSFFADIFVTPDIERFVEQISSSKDLKAYDVAKFILSIKPVSHLKLQKLLYYCYADYLIKTKRQLFIDPIVAFKYGPVVEDVFHKYRYKGSSSIDYKEDEVFFIHAFTTAAKPSFVRIISSNDGIEAAKSIIETLKKYIKCSASDLVEKTHKHGGPWSRVYSLGSNSIITDEIIKKYHHIVS